MSRDLLRRAPYLILFLGPQGAWEDQWSTRWNPNGNNQFPPFLPLLTWGVVFAAQGYVTVMINPTGSTTFGQGI